MEIQKCDYIPPDSDDLAVSQRHECDHEAEIEQLRATLKRAREAMVFLAALAGSNFNQDIPWAEIANEARRLGA